LYCDCLAQLRALTLSPESFSNAKSIFIVGASTGNIFLRVITRKISHRRRLLLTSSASQSHLARLIAQLLRMALTPMD
jgi:hypothetical protein